jgi:2,3-bisphosphoglycerate-dependent phosphoglycerate mutase
MAFARHADYAQLKATPSAHQPFALTESAIEQAKEQSQKLAAWLSQNNTELHTNIDSSHMLRAWQTATIFQQNLTCEGSKAPVVTCYNELAERSVGAVANLSVEQIEAIVDADPRYDQLPEDWKSNSYFQLPFQAAESLMQAGERVAKHITKQMQALPTSTANQLKLFVGHGASFRHAAYQLGILEFDMIARLSMYHSEPLYFEYFDDGSWQHIDGMWKQRQPKVEAID